MLLRLRDLFKQRETYALNKDVFMAFLNVYHEPFIRLMIPGFNFNITCDEDYRQYRSRSVFKAMLDKKTKGAFD